jgi:hypothetical protein
VDGIVSRLAELPRGAIVYKEAMADIFMRHPASIDRAVQRGELPPPTKMFGKKAWTAGCVLDHIQSRLEHAASEDEEMRGKIQDLRPANSRR